MRSIWLRVGIIAAIVVVFVVLRPFLSGNAGTLSVGECFDPPTGVGQTVTDVQHHPCTDSHVAEVFFTGNFTGSNDNYPTDADFQSFYTASCVPAFNTYTGLSFDTDTTYEIAAYKPTTDGWSGGDREVICYADRMDGATMTQSIKKTN